MESHCTATGLVINKSHDKALLVFHKKLQLWLPAGGHVEPGEQPHLAAIREVFEETGIQAIIIDAAAPLNLKKDSRETQLPAPKFVLHEFIPAYHDKPEHMHYDFLYHMQAEDEICISNELEIERAQWFSREELLQCSTTEAVKGIYSTLL